MCAKVELIMEIKFRITPMYEDAHNIREIVNSTGFFYNHEVEVAVELLEVRLKTGIDSGYYFVFADVDGKTAGYSCFGPIACTKSSYDLFWIATHSEYRGKGIGKKLLEETYKCAKEMGCTALYAETSAKDQYAPTREFYDKNGFFKEALLKDFYDIGDDKLIYVKKL
jgi:ribosomal protein S18 acetylase RimI-like enzyme